MANSRDGHLEFHNSSQTYTRQSDRRLTGEESSREPSTGVNFVGSEHSGCRSNLEETTEDLLTLDEHRIRAITTNTNS